MEITATIIKDSVNLSGNRLTTFVLFYPRFIHPQVLTHRVFSRNTSSSRAIPVSKAIEMAATLDVTPISYGQNQKGMSARDEEIAEKEKAQAAWSAHRDNAILTAKLFAEIGLHKQHANRVLEPFLPITCLLSATEFDNFFFLRLNHDVQPETRDLAIKMKEAMLRSEPEYKAPGEMHIPFVSDEELDILSDKDKIAVSIARCARVSYFVPGETKPSRLEADLDLAKKLIADYHLSPTEHVATALSDSSPSANFRGWRQVRADLETLTFD